MKTEIKSNDLTGVKLHELTGPQHWSYEGVVPHFYVIEKDGIYYAFWEDKDSSSRLDALMDPKELKYARFTGHSMEELIDNIEEAFGEEER
jgi:hypothetical protein